MKKRILLAGAALSALSLVSPAAALSLSAFIPGTGQRILYSELCSIREKIHAMPFVKADAYLTAINEYCFPEKELKDDGLQQAAIMQSVYGDQDLLKAMEKAETHSRGDQNACGPARNFVERIIDELPETRLALDELVSEFGLLQGAIVALDEADGTISVVREN